MSDKAFLDTNLLIYLYSDSEPQKRNTAYQVLNGHDCTTSIQALNEASNVWFKKCGWNGQKIKEHINNIELVCHEILAVQKNTIVKALEIKDRYSYSYYDCLMLSSALEGQCNVIFTEDMQDEQIIDDKLAILNPFK